MDALEKNLCTTCEKLPQRVLTSVYIVYNELSTRHREPVGSGEWCEADLPSLLV